MTRKLKVIAVALFATLATSAVVASAASAANFTAAGGPATVKFSGNQNPSQPHEFAIDGYKAVCGSAEFTGKGSLPSSTMTLSPKYTECVFAGVNATINMNGCDYLHHLTSTTSMNVDLVCPAGKSVTINAGGGLCIAHINPFTGKSHSAVSNGFGGTIETTATFGGYSVSLTDAGGPFCPFTSNTTVHNATYTGKLTISGDEALLID